MMLILIVVGFLTFSTPSYASRTNCRESFWQDVRELVQNCTEQPAKAESDPTKDRGLQLRADCTEIKVMGTFVHFKLYDDNYIASVTESDFADGGDLFDVFARNSAADCYAELKNVPSYGDPLAAISGGAN